MDDPTPTPAPDAVAPERAVAAVNLVLALTVLARVEREARRRRLVDTLVVVCLALLVAALYVAATHAGIAPSVHCGQAARMP